MPLTALKPSPDFTATASASRAWTKTVTNADDLPGAIKEALDIVTNQQRHALLDVKILPG